MKVNDLIDKLTALAELPSVYVSGCLGKRLTPAQKKFWCGSNTYNRQAVRQAKINAAPDGAIGADCICIIKAIQMGHDLTNPADDCGVRYSAADDVTDELMISRCEDVSSVFDYVAPGEMLWIPGHAGVYIGNGLAVECTPSWKDGIQITAVANLGQKAGYPCRKWQKHGRFRWVEYPTRETCMPVAPVLTYGTTGTDVAKLQTLLNAEGESLDIDGSFGPATLAAVKAFQKGHLLDIDGSVGPMTWTALLK